MSLINKTTSVQAPFLSLRHLREFVEHTKYEPENTRVNLKINTFSQAVSITRPAGTLESPNPEAGEYQI